MSRTVRLTRCLGLDPESLPGRPGLDPETGCYRLAEARNVVIDRDGTARLRPGFRRLSGQGMHSLFPCGDGALGVAGDRLRLIGRDGSHVALRRGLTPDAPMAYARQGGRVFYANGREKGLVVDGRHEEWGGRAFPGPVVGRSYEAPPAGHLLESHGGRIFIARGGMVLFTEGAGLFHFVDPALNWLPPMSGRVRLLRSTGDGLYLGDDQGVLFAEGRRPDAFVYRQASPLAPIEGAALVLDPARHPLAAGREISGPSVLWADARGLVLGQPGGRVVRVAEFPVPPAARGAAAVHGRSLAVLFTA